jgi:murein DD-endopeptidase MepM/ murein hydrolase activator NlpD
MGGYGYTVRIDHNNGKQTYYAHNSRLLVSVGQHVYKGQQIAKMGSTGNSTGNHCHFEVRINGVSKNPMSYLP